MSSIASRTAVRFLADASSLAFGMASGVVTARWLGPEGKGTLASLMFLGAACSQLSCLGLQEASIVLIGQRRATAQTALSATLAALAVSTAAGLLGLWGAGALQLGPDRGAFRPALAAACLGLVVSNYASVLSGFLIAHGQIVASSALMAVTSGLVALLTWVLVAWLRWSVSGGVLAAPLGALAGLALSAALVRSLGFSLRPRWDRAYVAAALRFGVGIQAAYLLAMMANRADLLVVYALAGRAEAGQYSVALTLGGLVMMVPAALSLVTFPVLARADDAEARALIARTSRYAVVASLAFGLALAALGPIALPLVFGPAYRPAVLPAVVLCIGGVPLGSQWLLARAAAARGRPALLSSSYAVSLVVMLALDVLLIPRFGILGAAFAAALAPLSGLAVCLHWHRRQGATPIRLADLFPGPRDIAELAARGWALIPRRGQGVPVLKGGPR